MKKTFWALALMLSLILGAITVYGAVVANTPAANGQGISGNFNFSANESTGLNNATNMTVYLRQVQPAVTAWTPGCSESNQSGNDTLFGCRFNVTSGFTHDQKLEVNFTLYNGSGSTFQSNVLVQYAIRNESSITITRLTPTNTTTTYQKQTNNATIAFSAKTSEAGEPCQVWIDNTQNNATANTSATGWSLIQTMTTGVHSYYWKCFDLDSTVTTPQTGVQQFEIESTTGTNPQILQQQAIATGQAQITGSRFTPMQYALLAVVLIAVVFIFIVVFMMKK